MARIYCGERKWISLTYFLSVFSLAELSSGARYSVHLGLHVDEFQLTWWIKVWRLIPGYVWWLHKRKKTLLHGHDLYLYSLTLQKAGQTVPESMVGPRTASTNLGKSMPFVNKISDQILDLNTNMILCKPNYTASWGQGSPRASYLLAPRWIIQ